MKRKKETSTAVVPRGNRKAKPSLKVNKVRHVFTRNRPAHSTASSDEQARGVGARKTVRGPSKNSRRTQAVRTLKKKVAAASSRKSTGKQSAAEAPEPDPLAKEKKVYRVLKNLHIDFKENKAGPSTLARTHSTAAVTRNTKRKSEGIDTAPSVSETGESSKDVTALPPSSTLTTRKRTTNVGHQKSTPSEEAGPTSKQAQPQFETVTKRTPKSSGDCHPGGASKSAPTEGATPVSNGRSLKKKVTKSKRGLQAKLAPSESMPKTCRASQASCHKVEVDVSSILPKTSKRFSTSVYSSRRRTDSGVCIDQPKNTTEPMDLGNDTTMKKDSSLFEENTPKMASATKLESFFVKKKAECMFSHKGESTFRRSRERESHRNGGSAKGFPREGGTFRSRTITNIVARGKGFAVSTLNSRGNAKLAYRGRVRKRGRWTLRKSDTDSAHEMDDTDKLSEPEGDTAIKTLNEPPSKRSRFKKVGSMSSDLNAKKDLDAEQKSKSNKEKTSRTQSRRSTQLQVAKKRNSVTGSVNDPETSSKTEMAMPKMLKNKTAMKTSSKSVESVIQDRSSVLAQIRSAAHSRSSSPGGTEIRSRSRDVSKTGELSRSTSLDNLLYTPDSPFALKQTRSRSSSKGGGSLDRRSSANVISKAEQTTPNIMVSSASAQASRKRKHSVSLLAERHKHSPAMKQRRLLTRLEDSSTHQIPNILFSGRAFRASAVGDSPAVSRESSPGTVPRIQRKRSFEHSDSTHTQMDTDIPSVNDEHVSSQTDMKASVATDKESKNGLSVNAVTRKADKEPYESKGTGSMPAEPRQQSTNSAANSIGLGVDRIRRGPGRPKGAQNKKFRLHHVKTTTLGREDTKKSTVCKKQFSSPLKTALKVGASLSEKRGRGRPRKIDIEGNSNQPLGQQSECENSNPDGLRVSASNNATEDKPLVKKTGRGRQSVKASQFTEDWQSAKHSDADSDKTLVPSSVKAEQSCGDLGNTSKDLSAENILPTCSTESASSSAAKEMLSNRSKKSSGPPQRKMSCKSNPLRPLAQMRRMNRRQMKKSRWSIGKLPKQSLAAMQSTIRLAKRRPVSENVLPQNNSKSHGEGEEASEVPPCPPMVSSDSGQLKTEMRDVSSDHAESIPSTDPCTVSHKLSSDDALSTATAMNDSSECALSIPSLAQLSLTKQSWEVDAITDPGEDHTLHGSEDGEQQEVASNEVLNTDSQQPCESTSTSGPELEDKVKNVLDSAEPLRDDGLKSAGTVSQTDTTKPWTDSGLPVADVSPSTDSSKPLIDDKLQPVMTPADTSKPLIDEPQAADVSSPSDSSKPLVDDEPQPGDAIPSTDLVKPLVNGKPQSADVIPSTDMSASLTDDGPQDADDIPSPDSSKPWTDDGPQLADDIPLTDPSQPLIDDMPQPSDATLSVDPSIPSADDGPQPADVIPSADPSKPRVNDGLQPADDISAADPSKPFIDDPQPVSLSVPPEPCTRDHFSGRLDVSDKPLAFSHSEELPTDHVSEEPVIDNQSGEPHMLDESKEPSMHELLGELSAHGHIEPVDDQLEPSTCDMSEESSMHEQSEEPSVGDQSVHDQIEPSTHDESEEPPMHLESSMHDESEESTVGNQMEESSADAQSDSVQDQLEPSACNDSEEPPRTESPECGQPDIGSEGEHPPVKSDVLGESNSEPQSICDTVSSTEQLTCEQAKKRSDASQGSDLKPSATVNLDTDMQSEEENVSPACVPYDSCIGTEAQGPQEHVCEDFMKSGLSASQLPEVKPDVAGMQVEDGQPQGMEETSVTEPSTGTERCDSKPSDLDQTKETVSIQPASPTNFQKLQKSSSDTVDEVKSSDTIDEVKSSDTIDEVKSSDTIDEVKKSDTECVHDEMKKSDTECVHEFADASQKNCDMDKQDSSAAEQRATAKPCAEDELTSSADKKSVRKIPIVPIAKRKQNAISRELKRLQTDEGAQRIMSWHEKKKLKSLGKLLRSKIKDDTDHDDGKQDVKKEQKLKPRSSKLYSIDAISDTRLVFKSGKSVNPGSVPEHAENMESMHDHPGSCDQDSAVNLIQEGSKRLKLGLLSVSSSMDSEDGPPPDITEMPPYKDSRSERGRSEELSPPPLIRPEDLFSEEYYESMSRTPAKQCQSTSNPVASGSEKAVTVPHREERTEYIPAHTGLTDIDTSQENETSGAFSINMTTKLGPRRKRGRGKRRYRKMGPASKTGRMLHVRPGPASSSVGRKTSLKQDPSFIRNMPHVSSEPRTFALRPKTTRSPIEIIAMRQKLEEEAYELEEATRVARKLKRRQALFGKLAMAGESSNQSTVGSCKPCSVVLVDFVKELHLNSIDTSDQYISDVSYDSDEGDMDDEEDEYGDEIYSCHPDEDFVLTVQDLPVVSPRTAQGAQKQGDLKESQELIVSPETVWKGSAEFLQRIKGTQQVTPGAFSSHPDIKRSPPDLGSLKGNSFMGNFVDFIQNRSSQQLPSSKSRSRIRPKTPVSGLSVSVTSSVNVSTMSPSCASELEVFTSSSASVVSVPSHSQVVTSAQIHTPRQGHRTLCPEDKTVTSSPSQAAESSMLDTVEKLQYSPHHHALTKSGAEKSSPSGKLKVFPARKESDYGVADRMAFTRYLCTKCDFSATNKGTIESHIYRHIPGVAFKCGYCESEFTGLISALTHVKNSHNSKEPKVWISKDINEASLYTEEEIRSCPEPVVTSPHSSQQDGPAVSADVTAQMCDPSLVQEGQPVFISLVVSGDRQTMQRPERFSSSPLATQRRFACTHCSYCTNVMDDAHQHVRDLHSDNSLFTCYLCDKAFGCSHQDILAHCRTTHPDRPKSFKKLPDFYDQELIRLNSGSSERSKGSEDRGNIFDRMNNFFPNMSSGSELMEDGQLTPQARFLRARDYLYIQEGWSKKTSAEADSTTIEDIEIPFEEAADVDSGLDSTSEGQVSRQHIVATDEGVLASSVDDNSVNTNTPSTSQSTSHDLSEGSQQKICNRTDSSHTPEQIVVSSNNQSSSAICCYAVHGQNNQTVGSKEEENGSSAVPESELATASGGRGRADGSGDGTWNVSAEHLSTGEGITKTEHLKSYSSHTTCQVKSSTSAEASTAEGRQTTGTAQGADADMECDDDGENDILVIDLGEDVDDIVDNASLCSSPQEETAESSFQDASTHAADVQSVEKEASSHMGSEKDMSGSGVRSQASSDNAEQRVLGEAENGAPGSDETASGTSDSDSMGIKILSVVSLSEKAGSDKETSVSPAKAYAGSEHDISPLSSASKRSHTKRSPLVSSKGIHAVSSRKKSGVASKHLPEVDADDIAMRNERMVCTYKCHTCSIHSPALAAIVEHLKQHHHDVSLFSCPYCKAKKESFLTEESVHTHVSEHHPSNYAKNEVSLSEIAKSFVQVLALPSGNHIRGSLIEEDIYMCLQCESHVPDLTYALRHLKYEHPGLLKYACPICGTFSNSLQDVVKKHMLEVHGQTTDSVQLAMAMEGVYLTKVTCISVNGQYVDHSPDTPPRQTPTTVAESTPAGTNTVDTAVMTVPASNHSQSIPVTLDSAALVSPSPAAFSPLTVVPVPFPQVSPLALTSVQEEGLHFGPSVPAKSGKQPRTKHHSSAGSLQALSGGPQHLRPILPMLGTSSPTISPKKRVDVGVPNFQVTGVTVKDMLDVRQKNVEIRSSGSVPLALDRNMIAALSLPVSTPSSEQLEVEGSSLTARGKFSMMDRLDRLGISSGSVSMATTLTASTPSRPVLRVPSVTSVLDLTSSRCLSVDTGTSVNTLAAGCTSTPTTSLSLADLGKHASSMPFSISALAGPVSTMASGAHVSLSLPTSPQDREDPEAFKIFNLKPRTPVPQSPRPSISPVVSSHMSSPSLRSSASPCMTQAGPLTPGAVTVASSALFPQQFRLQHFPAIQPASIATLPLAQGGLPLAQNFAVPIGASLPLNQGLAIPVNVNQPQLLMAQNTFSPVLVPANFLPQLSMRGPIPQLPVVSGTAPPPAHQPTSEVQTAPVNLSLTHPGQPAVSVPSGPKLKGTKSSSSFQMKVGPSRGRGRPRLHHKSTDQQPKPRIPGNSTPRFLAPSTSSSASPQSTPERPVSCPISTSRQSETSPGPKPQRHSTSHQCVCPYCTDTLILKPWEVAQHIKMQHPGKEVKYNRV